MQTDLTHCGACATVCAAEQSCCAGVCRNLHADSQNCGACGTICGSGTTCISSVCKTLCPGPANCLTGQSGCAAGTACMGSGSGPLVCMFDGSQTDCTTDLDCEQAKGTGWFCAVNVGSDGLCQAIYLNTCAQ
jgi:hypothetical protein